MEHGQHHGKKMPPKGHEKMMNGGKKGKGGKKR